MKENVEIDETLYYAMKLRSSQPARLYGLSKVHQDEVPMRQVISMLGLAYHEVAQEVTEMTFRGEREPNKFFN